MNSQQGIGGFGQKTQVDIDTVMQGIHQLATLSEADFQKTEAVDQLTHSLFSKVVNGELHMAQDDAKSLKKDLKILKLRIAEHPLLDIATKKNCKTELKNIIGKLRENTSKSIAIKSELPKSVLSLLHPDTSMVADLWARRHIRYNGSGILEFSDELSEVLDDKAFEVILKFSPRDSNHLRPVTMINIARHPLLGVKAPALMSKYCNCSYSNSFACMAEFPE